MRYLKRPRPAPECLATFDYNRQEWCMESPNYNDRQTIWVKLDAMQGGLCCYCESLLENNNKHIEHFFHKGKGPDGTALYKHLTFDWDNLFGCCGKVTGATCGHYKDRKGENGPGEYNANTLIKPDADQPSLFFNYLISGEIDIKPELPPQEKHRAEETLRVLNLNELAGRRRSLIEIFSQRLTALISENLEDEELITEMQIIKEDIIGKEYQTAILNSLQLD